MVASSKSSSFFGQSKLLFAVFVLVVVGVCVCERERERERICLGWR